MATEIRSAGKATLRRRSKDDRAVNHRARPAEAETRRNETPCTAVNEAIWMNSGKSTWE